MQKELKKKSGKKKILKDLKKKLENCCWIYILISYGKNYQKITEHF